MLKKKILVTSIKKLFLIFNNFYNWFQNFKPQYFEP